MEHSSDIQRGSRSKSTKHGPHLPPYIWRNVFPDAKLVYLDDEERASKFLSSFGEILYQNALNEGDAIIGFDVEWRAREKGQRTLSPNLKSLYRIHIESFHRQASTTPSL